MTLGFTGIAVALLGRNHPVGIVLAALLFAGLDSGARQLSGEIPAELARALATIIQGAVILFVGGEGLLHWLFRRRGAEAGADADPAAADRRRRRHRPGPGV